MIKSYRYITFVLAFLCISGAFAQLTDAETKLLATKVGMNYEEFGIEGAKVYQTPKHWTLVSIVTVTSDMNASQLNRQAQMKATRAAAEFLKGATNKSISIYDAYSNGETSFTEQNNSSVLYDENIISSNTSTGANEQTAHTETETMTDKIVQSSLAKIDGMQPLLKFNGDDGEIIYAYYMVIRKHKAKQKR